MACPVRISADPKSPHWAGERVADIIVHLDGAEVRWCVEADDVEGWVDVIVEENGKAKMEPDPEQPGGERLVIQRRTGRVQFLMPTTEGQSDARQEEGPR